ncbi:hypothetical protein AB4Z40_34890, partial [Bosea sp. 2YAB26]|uniref:hypothetical protein n=1 Tax=Bosea sp. 2YAB26 TaxID=3237478 RepID=UPI003F90D3B4
MVIRVETVMLSAGVAPSFSDGVAMIKWLDEHGKHLGARPSNDFGAIMTGRLGARFRCPVLILRLLQASGGCERYRSLPIRLGP